MSCDPRLLSYYRDGALSYEERYELERHLEVCTECTTTLRGLMRLAQVVRSLPMAEVSPSLRHELRQRIAAREERRRRPLPLGSFGRALAPAAVAASVAVSALVIFRPGSLELPNKPLPAITAQAPAAQALLVRRSRRPVCRRRPRAR
jgi:anti-sigma factor RsiW